jgi:hypothetical protein
MKIKKIDEKYGRPVLIGAVILIWVFIIWSFFANGYVETWYFWSIPAKSPPFLDFRMISGGAETFRSGIDPAVSNPNDPRGRVFNYPKVWYLIFNTGISQDDTIWICIVLLILFFLIAVSFPDKISVRDVIILLLVVFSPASMFLYERGNVDLIIFILCGLTIIFLDRLPGFATGILSVAAILKLFPFFGVTVFFHENRGRFYKFFLSSLAIFLLYAVLSFDSLKASWQFTQRGTLFSYGVDVIFDLLHAYIRYYLLKFIPENQIGPVVEIAPHLFAFLLLAMMFFLAIIQKTVFVNSSERNISAFRMGASIYVGTFLLGNNWDYRLAFLAFAAPQISQWVFTLPSKTRWLLLGILTALFASCWSTIIGSLYTKVLGSEYELQLRVFDEVMNWALFAGLAYLLIASSPTWYRSFSWLPSSQDEKS